MSKVNLNYEGQEQSARRYLMSLDKYSTEQIALMTSSQVEIALSTIVAEYELSVVYMNSGQDIGLVPKEVADQIIWLSR